MQATEFCNLTPPPTLVTHVPTGNRPVDVALAISADASRIAYAEPGAVAVVVGAGRPVARLPVGSDVTGLTFAADADALLIMSNRAVRIGAPGRPLVQIPQASPPIHAQLSADGSTVAAAQIGGTVGVWRVATGPRSRACALGGDQAPVRPPEAPDRRRSEWRSARTARSSPRAQSGRPSRYGASPVRADRGQGGLHPSRL